MPFNVLSLGCSHSLGYYNEKNEPSHQNTWPNAVYQAHKEKINQWWHIALPGHGIIDYCWTLLELEKNNLLDKIDTLVIQYTSEPRIIFYPIPNVIQKFFRSVVHQSFIDNNKPYSSMNLSYFIRTRGLKVPPLNMASTSIIPHIVDGVFTSDNYQRGTKEAIEQLKHWDLITSSFSESTAVRFSIKYSHQEIKAICERNNIKLFQFIWPYVTGPDWMIEDDIKYVDENISDYRKIANKNLHVNKIGCDIINKNILEHLKYLGKN